MGRKQKRRRKDAAMRLIVRERARGLPVVRADNGDDNGDGLPSSREAVSTSYGSLDPDREDERRGRG
jgi:hypothetical protein